MEKIEIDFYRVGGRRKIVFPLDDAVTTYVTFQEDLY